MKSKRLPERRRFAIARVGAALLLAVASLSSAAAFDAEGYDKAIRTILCDCGCHPQSVKDCACGRAAAMREEIAGLIAGEDGGGARTGEAVIALYVERSGEQILVAPKARGFNLLAWLGPFLVLAMAIAGVTLLARHWSRRQLAGATSPGTSGELDPQDPYLGRLRRDLEERE